MEKLNRFKANQLMELINLQVAMIRSSIQEGEVSQIVIDESYKETIEDHLIGALGLPAKTKVQLDELGVNLNTYRNIELRFEACTELEYRNMPVRVVYELHKLDGDEVHLKE